jgi:hypothetical protein
VAQEPEGSSPHSPLARKSYKTKQKNTGVTSVNFLYGFETN